MASLPLSAQAAFKKTAGILTLTDSLLSWTPTTPAGPKSQAAFSEATTKILGKPTNTLRCRTSLETDWSWVSWTSFCVDQRCLPASPRRASTTSSSPSTPPRH